MAQTPAKIGTVLPSITVFCACMARVSACAMVRRIVPIGSSSAFLPGCDQPGEAFCHHSGCSLVIEAAGKPAARRFTENRAADGESLDRCRALRCPEGLRDRLFRSVEPEQQHAAAIGVMARDDRIDLAPCSRGGLALELPPVGLDADGVESRHHPSNRVVSNRSVLRGNDLDQQFPPDLSTGEGDALQYLLLRTPESLGVIRMVEAQAFGDMADRPLGQG